MSPRAWLLALCAASVLSRAGGQGGQGTCQTTCSGSGASCRGGVCGCEAGFAFNSSSSQCDSELLRRSPPAYSDGVFEPSGPNRPNPFRISDTAHAGDSGQGSVQNRTAMLVFFGQQLVEEIMDVQRPGCPREFFNIPVPPGHPYNPGDRDDLHMPFLRSRYNQRGGHSPNNPRQQLNEITPYIDGNLMYGAGKAVADAVRSFSGGRLAARDETAPIRDSLPVSNDIRLPMANPPSPRDHTLRPVSRFYRLGNPRGLENPFLLSFGVLWFRYHNYWAARLQAEHSDWGDERLFDEARKRVIAQYQKLVFKDWLPEWLGREFFDPHTDYSYYDGTKNPYNGYDPNVHPGISQEFQTAALRFGHTLVPSGVFTRKNDASCAATRAELEKGPSAGHEVLGLRLCNSYWVSQEAIEDPQLGVDSLFLGLAFTKAEKEDRVIVSDLRGEVFGPLDWSRRDLAALNIQRGRDHGLPGYNDVRQAYGLPRKASWRDIADQSGSTAYVDDLTQALDRLQALYGGSQAPDELDVFTGGLMESTEKGPGELFRAVTIDQFLRIRHGDRFWYENRANGLLTEDDVREIESTSLRDILLAVTNIPASSLQDNVFVCQNSVGNCECLDPFNVKQDSSRVENCTGLQHYDYFSGSELSLPLTFAALGVCLVVTVATMVLMVRQRKRSLAEQTKSRPTRDKDMGPDKFSATEWLGEVSGERVVLVELVAARKKIMVLNAGTKKTERMIDLRQQTKVTFLVAVDNLANVLAVKVPHETDLILHFETAEERRSKAKKLESFLQQIGVDRVEQLTPTARIHSDADTHDDRKKLLTKFFRAVSLHVFERKASPEDGLGDLDQDTVDKIYNVKLTRSEFAEAMGMEPSSLFVRNMFLLVDRQKNGFVSFDEFMRMFITMARGSAEDKAKMLFDMYDTKNRGVLSRNDFAKMIRAMLDLADTELDSDDRVDQLIHNMFQQAGLTDKSSMTFQDFCKIFASEEHGQILKDATIGLGGGGGQGKRRGAQGRLSMADRRQAAVRDYADHTPGPLPRRLPRMTVRAVTRDSPATPKGQRQLWVVRYVENHRLQIFWGTLYTLLLFGIFIERAYYYSVEREHAGLRRLAGFGVSITRGAASAMMFTYASLLVTMSRNTLTFLRETFLHRFVPFDSFHDMHKYVAAWALFFTVMHCIGHGFNLYHISTQASSDLNCYFREYFRATHELASFHYWAWNTITGLSGIFLTVMVIVMYVFALPFSRRYLFKAFWRTHKLYMVIYFGLTIHGAGRLVQDPLWGYFFLGPVIVFVLDKLVSVSRNKVEINVTSATLLPSGVTRLVFRKPHNFEYKSGQWVRIACTALSDEYHPFTLTTAPHEDHLSLHIRAVGPWTNNIRRLYDPSRNLDLPLPRLFVDGPFGEGHQDWYRFPVSVLVGGGIGVTPFASILKDLVFKSKLKLKFPCQKVYFLWVTRTQKSFEWLTSIIQEVERGDERQLVDVHIFITQYQQRFDLRTSMLYLCERHFQRIEGRSLFTGLRAITHFGRPQFEELFQSLSTIHEGVGQIGVFSCGPQPMTQNVDRACSTANRQLGPAFVHHFENF
ncbi:dual oxidase 2-like isoform X2 [Babylonia areolata]|uniref:dual oxidase 2-like isoform X2 n=1 Tax=Babylonia areolata TaxID=304850 RepID=UPI003FD24C27